MQDSQILIPDAFIRLFAPPEKRHLDVSSLMAMRKLSEPAQEIARRYEVAEDMAHMLGEQAKDTLFRLHISETDVIDGTLTALESAENRGLTGLSEGEAAWTVARMAELLGWTEHLPHRLFQLANP